MFVHSRYSVAAVMLAAFDTTLLDLFRLRPYDSPIPRSARNGLDHKANTTEIIRERKFSAKYCQRSHIKQQGNPSKIAS